MEHKDREKKWFGEILIFASAMVYDKEKYSLAIELWREWNAKINVISRKDSDFLFEHHILHSLAIAEYMRRHYAFPESQAPASRILDLGTGGGFPGIPLAMEWPQAQFTLCDSIGKKVMVAQAVSEGLGLANVSCVKARAEELEGEWDFVVSRAVAPLDSLYSWVGKKFSGSLVCLKGGDVNPEIAVLLKRFGLSPRQIRIWKISDWLDDEYFAEKFVIEVGKSYLCSPFDEKYKKIQ